MNIKKKVTLIALTTLTAAGLIASLVYVTNNNPTEIAPEVTAPEIVGGGFDTKDCLQVQVSTHHLRLVNYPFEGVYFVYLAPTETEKYPADPDNLIGTAECLAVGDEVVTVGEELDMNELHPRTDGERWKFRVFRHPDAAEPFIPFSAQPKPATPVAPVEKETPTTTPTPTPPVAAPVAPEDKVITHSQGSAGVLTPNHPVDITKPSQGSGNAGNPPPTAAPEVSAPPVVEAPAAEVHRELCALRGQADNIYRTDSIILGSKATTEECLGLTRAFVDNIVNARTYRTIGETIKTTTDGSVYYNGFLVWSGTGPQTGQVESPELVITNLNTLRNVYVNTYLADEPIMAPDEEIQHPRTLPVGTDNSCTITFDSNNPTYFYGFANVKRDTIFPVADEVCLKLMTAVADNFVNEYTYRGIGSAIERFEDGRVYYNGYLIHDEEGTYDDLSANRKIAFYDELRDEHTRYIQSREVK